MSRGASLSVGRAGVGITIPKSSALPWKAGWTVKDSDFCCGSQVISARWEGCVTSRSSAAKYEHAAQASTAISAPSNAAHLVSLFMVMSSLGGEDAMVPPRRPQRSGEQQDEEHDHEVVLGGELAHPWRRHWRRRPQVEAPGLLLELPVQVQRLDDLRIT